MKMIKVKSSNVEAIGYNPDTKELRVQFKGGAVYKYNEIPHIIFCKFITAESYGNFLAENIKGKYEFKKLKG